MNHTRHSPKWEERFMDMAKLISGWSKDRSRGVGCVIVNDQKSMVAAGYNGFARGVNDDIDERHERPVKYQWTEHAERNAIYNAVFMGINISGTIMYIDWFPCTDCARAIIQSGIKRIVCTRPTDNVKYGSDFVISEEMLREAGVDICYYGEA